MVTLQMCTKQNSAFEILTRVYAPAVENVGKHNQKFNQFPYRLSKMTTAMNRLLVIKWLLFIFQPLSLTAQFKNTKHCAN